MDFGDTPSHRCGVSVGAHRETKIKFKVVAIVSS